MGDNTSANDTLTIIIPAFNEEERIGSTISSLLDNLQQLKEIIVVSDGDDNTPNVSRAFGDKVKVLKFNRKLGKGGAIIEGLKVADSEIIGFTDADGSAPWYEVQRLSKMIGQKQHCVIGSRWAEGANVLKRQSMLRIVLGRAYHYIAFAFLKIKVKDLQCGLKIFDRELVSRLLPKVRVKDWAFDTSLLYNVDLLGYDIKEVGIIWSNDEKTKLKVLKAAPLMLAYVIGLRIAHSKYSHTLKPAMDKVTKAFDMTEHYQ